MSELSSLAQSSSESVSPGSLTTTERLRARFFRPDAHPYRTYEAEIQRHLCLNAILLDAGCGRNAEVLTRLRPSVRTVIGADVVDFETPLVNCCSVLKNDICQLALRDNSVDVVISRSVLEHIPNPAVLYREVHRVLKPGGRFVFLTPNLFDYGSLCSKAIPNRWHPLIVRLTEGRSEADTFPVYYKSNTAGAVRRLAAGSGFGVERLSYLGQYPSYLMFNPVAFLIGTAYEKLISRFTSLAPLRGWLLATLQKDSKLG